MKHIITASLLTIATFYYSQKTVDVKLNLRDGSNISGTTTMSDVMLKTNYGQLNVPIQNVSTITVGLGSDKSINDRAFPLLKILNTNSGDDTKKAAYQDVIKLGIKAITAIDQYLNDPKNNQDAEITGDYTIDAAIAELKNTYLVDDVSRVNDVVMIDNDYTMGGTYEFTKLEIKTEYGNLSIPKEKIKSIEVSYSEPGNGNDVVLRLNANKHISGNLQQGWLKTGIILKPSQKFSITASGEVTLASLSNQKYKPDGSYISSAGAVVPAVNDDYASGVTYPAYGNVVYKIGETAVDVLKAGAKLNTTAKTGGMLFISIYETVYNAANSGSYSVKISVK